MKQNNFSRRDFIKLAAFTGTTMALSGKLVSADNTLPTICLFSWDGADFRTIISMLHDGELPNLAQLNVARLDCVGRTETKPGHVEALTGADYWKTRVYTNNDFKEVRKEWTLFGKIKETHPDYWCGCIFSKGQHTGDNPGEPWRPLGDWAREGGIEFYFNPPTPIRTSRTNEHLENLITNFTPPGMIYCHWAEPDTTGHSHNMDSPEYKQRLSELDNSLGQLLYQINPDIVILHSDHGFDGPGEHTHYNAPHGFIAGNINLAANGARRDIAYTILSILGLSPNFPNGEPLDGKDLRIRNNRDSWYGNSS